MKANASIQSTGKLSPQKRDFPALVCDGQGRAAAAEASDDAASVAELEIWVSERPERNVACRGRRCHEAE